VLKKDLRGPGVTAAQVLQATDFVAPCLEIVDSRIQDWKIKIQDTVADNASCGCFVLGANAVDPRRVDLATCGVVMSLNGALLSTGAGAAARWAGTWPRPRRRMPAHGRDPCCTQITGHATVEETCKKRPFQSIFFNRTG